jgi:GDP-L-fucose synthase
VSLSRGAPGFSAQYVVRSLRERACVDIVVPRRAQYDLIHEAAVERMYQNERPDMVIHLAATVGGIGANRANPGRFAYENLVMGAMLLEYARQYGVEKFVAVGTICSYPKFAPIPFREEDLWNGYPEETNAPYGLAKKMLLVQGQAYRQQYGMNVIHVLPVNLYGPGDSFDSDSSHVIPAVIRKCFEAIDQGLQEIECWGDGTPTREFLHVEDCARAIVMAAERYDSSEPVNIGAGFEITTLELVERIAEFSGFTGRIVWNTAMPNGQPRRRLDTRRAEIGFGFRAQRDFSIGLRETVDWYRENHRRLM